MTALGHALNCSVASRLTRINHILATGRGARGLGMQAKYVYKYD